MFRGRMFQQERFFRGSRRWASFHRGDLKYIILDLLKDKPRHGYDIIRELEEQSYGFYKPSPGVIYPTLQMLQEMGYVSSTEQEGKRVYSITEEGLKFLETQSGIADDVRRHMRHRWGFASVGRMVRVMAEYRALEDLLGRGFRRLDADKAELICGILSRAYREIESVLEE
ncbi:MAG: PadR family transcriptional regulator [Dehalococcoidia bacterium]|nr:PadR family transcriptional regulator [Dehalococcoidia bacterium]MDH4299906.1 PadR family transcriptional regulator [Dehalococcoidia bacterium]